MSIIFRLKYALGMIPSADQLDAKWEKLIKMRDDLDAMENSAELKRHFDLKSLIDSAAFQQKRREIESLQFSGSEEEKMILSYKTLAKSKQIRNYQIVSVSPKLERFQKIVQGSELERYLFLENEVGCKDFKIRMASQKKKAFVQTDDYPIFAEYNQVRKSADIRFWKKYNNSESYQSYLNTVGSIQLLRYDELCGMTASDEFKKRVAYLKDKKKFLKSDEHQKILEFKELDSSAFMAEYRKLKKARELDFFEKWNIVLDENFIEKELNTQQWQPENWLGFKLSGVSFSQNGEMQAFNGIKNIQVLNNTLSLWAKKEQVTGRIWNPVVGLIPKQFEYTSSIMNNADFFRMKEGVVEAKLRFKKDATITSAFSLTGDKPFPQIDLVRSTKNGVGLGIIERQDSKSSKYKKINGLNAEHYHIYRIELYNSQFVWKINGHEVYRNSVFVNDPLFFNLLTTLHGDVSDHLLPHRFEVDWIRCFTKK